MGENGGARAIDCELRLRYSRAESGGPMRKLLLLFWLTAAVVALSVSAAAQATFETLMTHSVSSAVGTHAGTTLGRATNALANRVAAQTPSVTSRSNAAAHRAVTPRRGALKTVPANSSGVAASQIPAGSLIASIQGGERNVASSCSQNAGGAKTVNQTCAAAVPATDSHPSVVNLAEPK